MERFSAPTFPASASTSISTSSAPIASTKEHAMSTSSAGNPTNAAGAPPVRIVSVAAVPLLGESPKGGWSTEIKREDSIHALIAVHTEAGAIGHGGVFTDGTLVAAARRC